MMTATWDINGAIRVFVCSRHDWHGACHVLSNQDRSSPCLYSCLAAHYFFRMKFVAVTNVIQIVCLLLLMALVLNRDEEQSVATAETLARPAVARDPMPTVTASSEAEEMQLRRIIRQELAVALQNRDEHRAKDAAAQQRSPEENRYQREYVSQQIDYYASVGSINEQEMQELQREIAELDTAGRKEMLSKLARTMNARQIKGQL